MRKQTATGEITGLTTDSAASLHFAYLTLESLIFRALLRPLGRHRKAHAKQAASSANNGQTDSHVPNSNVLTSHISPDMLQAKEATYISALNCASLLTSFAASLDSSDFGSFWYSCKNSFFAMRTSFSAANVY